MFPFKSSSTIGKSEQLALNDIVSGKRIRLFSWFVLALLTAYLAFLAFIYIKYGELDPFSMVCAAIAAVLLLLYVFGLPALIKHRVNKYMERNGATAIDYEFFEDRLSYAYENKTSSGSSTVSYSALTKVVESGTAFYLFNSAVSALVVDKSQMTPDQAAALRSALKNYVPEGKYVIKNK